AAGRLEGLFDSGGPGGTPGRPRARAGVPRTCRRARAGASPRVRADRLRLRLDPRGAAIRSAASSFVAPTHLQPGLDGRTGKAGTAFRSASQATPPFVSLVSGQPDPSG